jgi:hypothetical protein
MAKPPLGRNPPPYHAAIVSRILYSFMPRDR